MDEGDLVLRVQHKMLEQHGVFKFRPVAVWRASGGANAKELDICLGC